MIAHREDGAQALACARAAALLLAARTRLEPERIEWRTLAARIDACARAYDLLLPIESVPAGVAGRAELYCAAHLSLARQCLPDYALDELWSLYESALLRARNLGGAR